MKILLVRYHDGPNINTRLPKNLNRIRGTMPPLGILFIAAYLEKYGYKVKILDVIAERMTDGDFIKYLQEYKPNICGVTTMLENYLGACRACKIAKDYGSITVLGGPGLEIYPKEMIDKDYIDFGVVGEGEETFLQLVRVIENDNLDKIKDIPGLSYNVSGQIIAGKPQIVRNLDLLPRPAYNMINIANYSSLINDYPVMSYIMGRGCPFQCSFCIKQERDKLVRYRSPELVVDDVEYLLSHCKIKELMFYDDTFTLSPKRVRSFCEEILRRGIKVKFESPTRIDSLVKPDGIDLLKLLRKAGCYRLRLGVESGDQDVLKRMNKKISLPNVGLAFERCKQVGIQTFAYFMVGYLGENEKSFNNTVNCAIKLNPDYVMFTVATPYPKTKLYDECFKAGLVPEDYWKGFVEGKRLERISYLVPNAEDLAKKAYRRFYFRLKYILNSFYNLKSKQHIKNAIQGSIGLLFYKNN